MDEVSYISIEVPDRNDSMNRIMLSGKPYFLRFTWNMRADCWMLGVYDALEQPIAIGIKVVPNYILNLYVTHLAMPVGAFIALAQEDRVGRYDFRDGKAEFVYVPGEQ